MNRLNSDDHSFRQYRDSSPDHAHVTKDRFIQAVQLYGTYLWIRIGILIVFLRAVWVENDIWVTVAFFHDVLIAFSYESLGAIFTGQWLLVLANISHVICIPLSFYYSRLLTDERLGNAQ